MENDTKPERHWCICIGGGTHPEADGAEVLVCTDCGGAIECDYCYDQAHPIEPVPAVMMHRGYGVCAKHRDSAATEQRQFDEAWARTVWGIDFNAPEMRSAFPQTEEELDEAMRQLRREHLEALEAKGSA
jgi:hypothetical protein